MADGRDVWFDEADGGRRRRVPGRAARRRASAVHPLHLGLDGEAEGDPAHDRRLPDAASAYTHKAVFDLKPDEDVYWCSADVGWVTGHSYIVYGPLANGATSVMYEGAPDYPGQGHLVGAVRALRRDDLLHGADGDPRLHQVGRGVPGAPRPVEAAAARDGRRADQPEGLALVPQGDRRRALPDRRHLVADRDRRDHDHDAAGRARHEARLGRQAAAGRQGGAWSTTTTRTPAPSRASSRSTGPGRGCCGRSTRRRTASSRRTGRSSATETYTRRRRRPARRGRLLLDHRAHRRRAQRLRPPDVDRRDRVGDRLLLARRRGGGDRPGRRGHGPVRDRVRDARGRRRRRPTS